MSEDKGLIGNLRSFHFFFHRKPEQFLLKVGRPGFREIICVTLALGANVAFTKWFFFFLAVFKGVFEVTYLTKKHPSGNLDTIVLFMIGI